jgi:polysaccharide deacetylase family protein (PEP-CTERM system associated)
MALQTPNAAGVLNAFSIDVEDYFHVEALRSGIDRSSWDQREYRVEANTHRCVELLAEAGVKATFFVLGWVAKRSPQLVRDINAAGHEVACHGLTHQMVFKQSPATFRDETREAKLRLEDAAGVTVRGYRAATYSITKASLWALDILEELDFKYDSSIFPVRHDLYGIPDAPRFAYHPGERQMLEVPITTVQFLGQRWPCGGGGYFRLLPYGLFRAALRRVNELDRQSAVFYCHPWELDPGQPRIAGVSLKSRFRHYTNLGKMEQRLRLLLADFRWGRMDEVFGIS